MRLVGTKTTTENFAKLDLAYLSIPGMYYSISAYNNGNGTVIQTGEVVEIRPDAPIPNKICDATCNGTTYAYTLEYYQYPQGGGYMHLRTASEYVNQETGAVVPYYQAINTTVYNAMMDIDHPYTQLTPQAQYYYDHIQITNETPGGPFFDAQHNVVTSGWLIEKKMDQFSYMDLSSTSAEPNDNICAVAVDAYGGWVSFYNDYVDETTLQQVPFSVEPFATSIPTKLECILAITDFGGGGEPGINWHEWYEELHDWFEDLESNGSLDGDPVVGGNFGSNTPFTGFEFEGLSNPNLGSIKVRINENGTTEVISKKGNLSGGLYKVIFYTNTGDVFPAIVEVPEANNVIKRDRDFVKLEINPNKIENNQLKFKVTTEKDLNVKINVQKLNGELLYTENTTLSKLSDLQRELQLNSENTPYNQIKVTLLFDDESSLQETALKL